MGRRMGRRKRSMKTIPSVSLNGPSKGEEPQHQLQPTESQSVKPLSAGCVQAQTSGRAEGMPGAKQTEETAAQTEAPSPCLQDACEAEAQAEAEDKEKEALIKEILEMQARLVELDALGRQQEMILEERERARAKRERYAQWALAACERERRRHKNWQLLTANGKLHGRGLMDQLELRWIKASKQRNIGQMRRWERWPILLQEHAEELRAVVVDGERVITEDVWDKLVPTMQQLHRQCVRNQGWLNDRLWIEADVLPKHGGRVLMALAVCFELCFTCIDKGHTKSSREKFPEDALEDEE